MELDEERPDSFKVSLKLSCAVCHAGAQPKSTPHTIEAARLKKRTGRFNRKSASDGRVKGGIMATITLSKPQARLMPKTPPINDNATLSVRNWPKSCQRVAPSAARTAISLWRAVPRARRRLATFTQAINRMKPTAPISSQRFLMVSLLMKSFCKGSTAAPHPLLDFG